MSVFPPPEGDKVLSVCQGGMIILRNTINLHCIGIIAGSRKGDPTRDIPLTCAGLPAFDITKQSKVHREIGTLSVAIKWQVQ